MRAQTIGAGWPDGSVAQAWKQVEKKPKPDPRRGKVMYEQSCMMCHGRYGGNDGAENGNLRSQPIPFKDAAAMGAYSDRDLFYVIAMGRERTTMPGFYPGHSASEIKDLVSYVRRLQAGQTAGPSRYKHDDAALLDKIQEKAARQRSKDINAGQHKALRPGFKRMDREGLSGTAKVRKQRTGTREP